MTEHDFQCWSEEGGEESYNRIISEFSAESAAETYAGRMHSALDYFSDLHVFVRAPDGVVTEWDIEARQETVFYATPRKPSP